MRGRRPRYDAVDDALRALIIRDVVAEAAAVLQAGVDGTIPVAQAACEAHWLLAPAIRMVLEGPVDGWPTDEAVA
jgi:hypothetical protein